MIDSKTFHFSKSMMKNDKIKIKETSTSFKGHIQQVGINRKKKNVALKFEETKWWQVLFHQPASESGLQGLKSCREVALEYVLSVNDKLTKQGNKCRANFWAQRPAQKMNPIVTRECARASKSDVIVSRRCFPYLQPMNSGELTIQAHVRACVSVYVPDV